MAPAIIPVIFSAKVVASATSATVFHPTRWPAVPTHVLQTRHGPSERGIGTQGSAGYAEECDAETEWEYVFEFWKFYAVSVGWAFVRDGFEGMEGEREGRNGGGVMGCVRPAAYINITPRKVVDSTPT